MAKVNAITVEHIGGLEALLKAGDEYDRFIESVPDMGGLFYARGWLGRIRANFDHPRKCPCFLFARKRSRLIGMAPLSIERKSWAHGNIRRLYFYGHWDGPLSNGHPGFIVPDEDNLEACVQAFLEYIVGPLAGDWDFLDLECFPQESTQLWLALTVVPRAKAVPEPLIGHVADLSEGYEAFLNNLPTSLKKDLRRRRRRLDESGLSVTFGHTGRLTPSQLSRVAEIHHARQETLRSKGFRRDSVFVDHETTAATFQSLLEYAADRGCARHYYVEINGEIAACEFCFAHRDTLVEYIPAFDDRYAKYALPKLLHLFLFEKESNDYRTRWVDMLRGTNRIKAEFASTLTRFLNVQAVNRKLRTAGFKRAWLEGARRVVAQTREASENFRQTREAMLDWLRLDAKPGSK